MNIQNLMSQLGKSTNPMSMLMGMLNPSQKQQVNQLQNKSQQEQAEAIARIANEKGLTKQDLQNIINMLNGKK